MKQLSKNEKFRLEKEKEKLKKRVIFWSIILIFASALIYWSFQAEKNTVNFTNPKVDLNQVPSGPIHLHPNLKIKINDENIIIPNNIGINPGAHSPTHTHEEGDGTIHVENANPKATPETLTLGYFFNIWRQPFNSTCILDKCTNIDGGELHMYVNDVENYEFEKYLFKGNEKIVLKYNQ